MAIAALAPKKLLTPAGLFHAGALGVILWGTLGWQGYSVMMFYFLAGSAVTRVGMAQKEALGIAEQRSGARGPENVWGSALIGTLCALGVYGATWNGSSHLQAWCRFCSWHTLPVLAPSWQIPVAPKLVKLMDNERF